MGFTRSFTVFLFAALASAQNVEWYRQFSHPLPYFTIGYSVAALHGSIYVAGSPGNLPALYKFDQNGNQIWERDVTTSGEAFGVAVNDGGIYVAGDTTQIAGQPQIFNTGAFIRKYDSDGNVLWTRLFAAPEPTKATMALCVALDSGGVYIAGFTRGTLPNQQSDGGEDIFIRKYDFNGNEMWTHQSGGGRATGIAANASGIYVTGSGGGPVAGQTGSEFLRKYEPIRGNVIWTRLFGGNLQDFVRGAAIDSGGVYVAGQAQTKINGQTKVNAIYDGFVRKFDFDGNELWNAEWGNGDIDDALGVAADGSGVYIVGETDRAYPGQTNMGTMDSYVRKYDVSGNLQWTKQIGAGGPDKAYAMAIDETGGYVSGNIAGGTYPGQKSSGNDAYVIKLTGITQPVISEVGNAFGDAPLIAPNTWVSIKGSGLAPPLDSRIWADADFGTGLMPTSLDRVSVTVNGKAAYVYYISPGQVDILTPPDDLSGSVQVQLTNGDVMSNIVTVAAAPMSASFFVFDGKHVTATHVDGKLLGPTTLYPGFSTPAQPGETIIVYANGFGPVSQPVVSGIVTQSGTLAANPVLTVGTVPANVTFAGLVSPGTFQFNVVLPGSLPSGDLEILATYNGQSTQKGTILTVEGAAKR